MCYLKSLVNDDGKISAAVNAYRFGVTNEEHVIYWYIDKLILYGWVRLWFHNVINYHRDSLLHHILKALHRHHRVSFRWPANLLVNCNAAKGNNIHLKVYITVFSFIT